MLGHLVEMYLLFWKIGTKGRLLYHLSLNIMRVILKSAKHGLRKTRVKFQNVCYVVNPA